MTVAVVGGTGLVGSAAVAALTAAGQPVRVIARREPASLPPGATFAQADLADPDGLAAALAGVGRLFLITPVVPEETALGLGAIAAARRAGVRKLAYLSIMNLEAFRGVPHFDNKRPILDALQASGMVPVVLAANWFFQNDGMVLPGVRQAGVYGLPLGAKGLDAVDARDIGAVAALALTSGRFDGQVVPVAGHDRLTTALAAGTYAELLGRPVRPVPDAAEAFAGLLAQVAPGMDPWLRDDLIAMTRANLALGNHAAPGDAVLLEEALGRPLRRYLDTAAELLRMPAPAGA